MSDVNSKQSILDLANAAALLQQSESLEETARKSFTDLLARLKKNRELLSKVVEPKEFEGGVIKVKGIFINLDKEYPYLCLNDDAEFFNNRARVHPSDLIGKHGAVKCIETLISAIRKRIDAITTQHASAQNAIKLANTMLPD